MHVCKIKEKEIIPIIYITNIYIFIKIKNVINSWKFSFKKVHKGQY